MERLSVKELRFVLDALGHRKEALKAKIDRGDVDMETAESDAEDLMLCDYLLDFFDREQSEELARKEAGGFVLDGKPADE